MNLASLITGDDVDHLVEVMGEICYVDAPGGPMLGRLGVNFVSKEDDEFWGEAVFGFGVSKVKVEEQDVGDVCRILEGQVGITF